MKELTNQEAYKRFESMMKDWAEEIAEEHDEYTDHDLYEAIDSYAYDSEHAIYPHKALTIIQKVMWSNDIDHACGVLEDNGQTYTDFWEHCSAIVSEHIRMRLIELIFPDN